MPMCNAWNHHPGCRCGWGGEGHLGRGGPSASGHDSNYFKSIPPIYTKYYETFVNPNAKCPVCGALVFFYQSPHGGRVFFDELGPPWPKHPCTIKNYNTKHHNTSIGLQKTSSMDYSWSLEGWEPFLGVNGKRWGYNYSLNGVYKKRRLHLNLPFTKLERLSNKVISQALWMVKPLDTGRYTLSMCYGNKDIEIVGSIQSASPHESQKRKKPFLSQKLGKAQKDLLGVDVACKRCGKSKWYSIDDVKRRFKSGTQLHIILSNYRRRQCPACKHRDMKVRFDKVEEKPWEPNYSYKRRKKKKASKKRKRSK